MPTIEILLTVFLAALAWFWFDSLKAREAAIGAARAACDADNVMLLDYTVAVSRMSFARDEHGRLRIKRAYAFEYSDTGNNRRNGSIILVGRRVVLLNVGVRDAPNVHLLH
jgi:hypothetical protein